MNTLSKIVIGLGFGDEGKGLATSFLCAETENPLVVRFNGGHQAGHTVVHEGKRHVFSNFGAGTLQGIPTYWSAYCTFYPLAFLNEYDLLPKPIPTFFINPLCPVTTPFDVGYNQNLERKQQHGSVGVGFGATLQRQERFYQLFVQDLFFPTVISTKLNHIADYYEVPKNEAREETISNFLAIVGEAKPLITLVDDSILQQYTPIFEGGQGVLLDMNFGFFPNVTRSNTTSKNALQLYPDADEIYYITRSYLTRHGNGFMPNEKKLNLKNNEQETNRSHPFQGEFRIAELNTELLNYALTSDSHFSKGKKKNLVITCCDQWEIDVPNLLASLNTTFDKVFISKGDSGDKIALF